MEVKSDLETATNIFRKYDKNISIELVRDRYYANSCQCGFYQKPSIEDANKLRRLGWEINGSNYWVSSQVN